MSSSGFDRLLDRTASVALIVAAAVLLWAVLVNRGPETTPGPAGVQQLDAASVVDWPRPSSVTGSSAARVAIIEFSDFECPFCARHAREVYPRLMEEYVDTGQVQYVFRHFPLDIHPLAIEAAEAAECAASQGMYWEMHDRLFAANAALTQSDLLNHAASLRLRSEDFESCLLANVMLDRVMDDRRAGDELGVTATPTFFFAEVHDDGKLSLLAKLSGAMPYSTFQSTLDELLSTTASPTGP